MTIINKKFTSTQCIINYKVDEEHEGMRLDSFMQIYLATFSRQSVKKVIERGEISIQKRPGRIRPSTKIHFHEIITMTIIKRDHEDEYWEGKKIELEKIKEIVYEDNDLLIISKPTFVSTHPTGRHLFNCATVHFEEKYQKTVHSIHRLDRETSGILLLAKNPKTANSITELFEKGQVKKCYFFIAKSKTPYKGEKEFIEESRLDNSEEGRKRVIISAYPKDSQQGKHAKTLFKILHSENLYSLGLAFPQTGRQHQIRVHALVNQLPLLGDKLYLGGYPLFQRFKDFESIDEDYKILEIPRHALHALAIKFSYQKTSQVFITHIPEDLKEWIRGHLNISIEKILLLIKKELEEF